MWNSANSKGLTGKHGVETDQDLVSCNVFIVTKSEIDQSMCATMSIQTVDEPSNQAKERECQYLQTMTRVSLTRVCTYGLS